MPTYAVRAPLARWLARGGEARTRRSRPLPAARRRLRPEAVRSRSSPRTRASYVGVDPVENPHAELRGSVEALPVEDDSFDVVLCIQVLEHCDDPALAVRELHRVTAPGGRVLASTHGVMVYHPSPADTGAGRMRASSSSSRDNGDWASVTVTPGSGTTACLAMLLSIYLDLAARRFPLGPLRRPVIAGSTGRREAIDGRAAGAARAAARDALRQLPRRRGEAHVSRRSSSPAAPASSARTSSARCSSAATRCACSTTSRPAAAPTSPTSRTTSRSSRASSASYERVHNAVRGAEVVFHLGALGSVPRSVQDPLTSTAVNVEGTLNVLLAARDEGIRRVVSASSSSVYGNGRTLPRTRRWPPDPISPVRRRQAGRGAVLRQLQPRLRSLETVVAPLLQRVRPAPGPELAVRRRRPALRHRDRGGRAGDDPRRRRAVARLHLRRRTSSRRTCSPPTAEGAERPRSSTSPPACPQRSTSSPTRSARLLGKPVETGVRAARGRATSRDSWADVSEARACSASSRSIASTRACGGRSKPHDEEG